MCRSLGGIGLIIALLLADTVAADQYAYQVTFTDKNSTPYSLSSPLAYLSSRAISRRATQGIAIDSTDLPVNQTYVNDILTLTGGKFHETSKWLNMCIILLSDSAQIHNIDSKPYISNIKLVGVFPAGLHKNNNIPNTEPAHKTTGFDAAYYGNTWSQTQIVNGNFLHGQGFDGHGKLIAVLDAGFIGARSGSGFNSLWASGRVVDSFNFTYDNDNVFTQDSHGTEVLSTMAGYDPGNFVGSAPGAMYALYLTEFEGASPADDVPLELDNMVSATERADSIGADVISISLGYNTFDNPADNFNFPTDFDGKTTIAARAANLATKKGMLFVASAGNEGGGPWNKILTPGDADSALTIGSVFVTGLNAANSGYGPNAAGQIKPDVCGMGQSAAIINSSGVYTTGNGTSLSTPQIAGWAACLWQANPNATPYQLRQAIIKCASSYSSPGAQLGYGIPNFQCTQQMLSVITPTLPFTAANWVIALPNPFTNTINLAVSPDTDQEVSFQLMDMSGKKIATFQRFLYKGNNKPFSVAVPELPGGIYMLHVISATQQKVLRLVKY